jgi:hypothetical protein
MRRLLVMVGESCCRFLFNHGEVGKKWDETIKKNKSLRLGKGALTP